MSALFILHITLYIVMFFIPSASLDASQGTRGLAILDMLKGLFKRYYALFHIVCPSGTLYIVGHARREI